MNSHNLLDAALRSLDREDWLQLHQWLACPLHHQHAPSLALFQWIADWYTVNKDLPPKELQPKDWADHGLSNLQFRKYRSLLLESVERFLAWKVWNSREDTLSNDLLEAYHLRNQTQSLQKRVRRDRKRFDQYRYRDSIALYAEFRREEIMLSLETNIERRSIKPFEEAEFRLLRYQIAERLRKAVATLARSLTSGQAIETPLLNEYLSEIERNTALLTEPAIALYYHACKLYLQPKKNIGADHFQKLTELLPQALNLFTPAEQTFLLKLTINFTIRRINREPEPSMLRTAFDLYQLGFKNERLYEDGYISVFTFNNFIGISLRLNEISVASDFIESMRDQLAPERRRETLAFNEARLYYAKGESSQALLRLQGIDYQDPFDLLNARMLQIRIYYEAGENQALYDLLRATRALLRRRQLGYHQDNFRNNLRMVQKLLRLKWNDKAALDKLKQQIISTKPLSEKEWLLEQMG
ncbi:MAG: hypothetical protein AAGF87_10690 [Bacteroidota bacterium]